MNNMQTVTFPNKSETLMGKKMEGDNKKYYK